MRDASVTVEIDGRPWIRFTRADGQASGRSRRDLQFLRAVKRALLAALGQANAEISSVLNHGSERCGMN